MKKVLIIFLVVLLSVSVFGGCSSKQETSSEEAKGKIVVGGKDFTEQFILSKITSIYLKEKGYQVEEANSMGSSVVRSALENGQIDLYWEYTGTALVIYQKQPVETDPVKTFEKVKTNDAKNGLVWLDMADFNNTYTLMMKEEEAKEKGINSISDLAIYVNDNPDELKFATNAEFYAREDGIKGLEKEYGFEFPANVVKMDSGLTYTSLKEGQVNVAMGFATDGRIAGFHFINLDDDKFFFPAYNAAPVVREEVLDKYPELKELLSDVAKRLDTKSMMNLNYLVDVEHKDVSEISRNWLQEQDLID